VRGNSVWFRRLTELGRIWQCTLAGCAALVIAGCGGSGGSDGSAASSPSPSTVASPAVINLYPVAATSSGSSGATLYVLVNAVGEHTGTFPLVFDTGSAGITLNALSIFPSSMVTSSGFVFPSGETSITYQGITVTNQQGTHSYGGSSSSTGTTYTGNLGYATVTFGDGQGTLTTQVMPVFLYYGVTAASGEAVSEAPQQGIFGVRSVESSPIAIAGRRGMNCENFGLLHFT
jgi:hypothetical protein